MVDSIRHRLQEINVAPNPSSRIAQHLKLLDLRLQGAPVSTTTPPDFRPYQQAIYELSLFDLSLRTLSRSGVWISHFRKSMGGALLPWDDTKHEARNYEFELYAATVFKLAGARVSPGEPDVLAELNGWRIGVAAKRLSSASPDVLVRRVNEGLEQIVRARVPGIVIADASSILIDRVHFVHTNSLADATRWLADSVEKLSTLLEASQLSKYHKDYHLAVLLIANMPVMLEEDGVHMFTTCMHRNWCMLPSQSDPRIRSIQRMMRALAKVPVY